MPINIISELYKIINFELVLKLPNSFCDVLEPLATSRKKSNQTLNKYPFINAQLTENLPV